MALFCWPLHFPENVHDGPGAQFSKSLFSLRILESDDTTSCPGSQEMWGGFFGHTVACQLGFRPQPAANPITLSIEDRCVERVMLTVLVFLVTKADVVGLI